MGKQTRQDNLIIIGGGLTVVGIIFISWSRALSYSFIGAGVLLMIIDLIRRFKRK